VSRQPKAVISRLLVPDPGSAPMLTVTGGLQYPVGVALSQ
jgi:hypothetical protein